MIISWDIIIFICVCDLEGLYEFDGRSVWWLWMKEVVGGSCLGSGLC